MSDEEKRYLQTTCPYLDPTYLDFLAGFRYDPSEVTIEQQGMGNVMGAAANWRPLAGAGGRTDLLAGQRNQLGRYTDGREDSSQRSQGGGGRYNEGESGNRGGTNAMEINKVTTTSIVLAFDLTFSII